MGWTALIGAIRDETGKWTTTTLAREPDVDSVARELTEEHSAVVVCFIFDSDVAYAVADAQDGNSARLVFNEAAARDYEMDSLPLGQSAAAAADLAKWAKRHAPKPIDPDDARLLLEKQHDFAEEGVVGVLELLGLPWPWEDPRELGK